MKYLRISNPGVAPLETLTTLGLSTSNSSNAVGVIGQFGTGMKHGINLLLRNEKSPIVFLGNTRVEFGSTPKTVHAPDGSHVYEQATITIDGEETELGYTLDFGVHDWSEVSMALREFISNAIDMTIKLKGTYQDSELDVRIVNEAVGIDDRTCVFVPVDDSIRNYVREIGTHFLHFSGDTFGYGTLQRNELKHCRLYREGVFVRELDQDSLFDYNFRAGDISIDESRNLDKYRARCIIRDHLIHLDEEDATKIVRTVRNTTACFEQDLMGESWELERHEYPAWQEACKEVFMPHHILCSNNGIHVTQLLEQGFAPVVVERDIMKALACQGMRTAKDVLTKEAQEGYIIVEANGMDRAIEDQVWECFKEMDAVLDKDKPLVKYYQEPEQSCGSSKLGFCLDGEVFINDILRGDSIQLRATIIEEYVHYISGCEDQSRGFQTFCCETLAKCFKHI